MSSESISVFFYHLKHGTEHFNFLLRLNIYLYVNRAIFFFYYFANCLFMPIALIRQLSYLSF